MAVVLTLTVLLGAGVGAAEASPMQGGRMMLTEAMPCGEHMPMPSHNMPCGHECCLGVLGCAALASGAASVIPAAFSVVQSGRPDEQRPDGLAVKPALPPPIA